MMQDPAPENITGEKVQQHVFKHQINWGHVVVGVAVIYAAWKGAQLVGASGGEGAGDGTEIVVEQGNDEGLAGHTGR